MRPWQETDEESGESKPKLDEEGKKVFQSTYTGQYVANLKDGEGVFQYPDGSKYQGNWRHDKRHGDGVYWYPNGDIYSGEWRFGTKHGRGTFIHAESNARLIGTYVDGKFVKGKWVTADATYTGGYKDNKPFGAYYDMEPHAAFTIRDSASCRPRTVRVQERQPTRWRICSEGTCGGRRRDRGTHGSTVDGGCRVIYRSRDVRRVACRLQYFVLHEQLHATSHFTCYAIAFAAFVPTFSIGF